MGSVKASTVPAATFMQHSLIPTSALYSRGQEIHQLTEQQHYMYSTWHPVSTCQRLLYVKASFSSLSNIQQEGICLCEAPHTLFVLYNSSPSSSRLDCEVCAASTVLREQAFSLSAYAGFTGSSIHIHPLSLLPKIEGGEGVLAHYHIVSCLKPV